MKLHYTKKQLEPIQITRRGAPKGNKHASKPDSQKAKKVQGYISPRQLQILIELEIKLSEYCNKKKLRSIVIGTAIEFLYMLIETVPVTMLGDEAIMNQPFLIAQDDEKVWTVIDMNNGIVYQIYPGEPVNFSKQAPSDSEPVVWGGIVGATLADQFSKTVMGRKNDQTGQEFNLAVNRMISGGDQ